MTTTDQTLADLPPAADDPVAPFAPPVEPIIPEQPAAPAIPAGPVNVATPQVARRLRQEMAAVRLMKGKWGISKKLDAGQTNQLAQTFGADPKLLSSAKRLINPKHERYREPCGILSEATTYWKSVTIPYPEDGIRLIRHERLEAFNATMTEFKEQLAGLAVRLDEEYQAIKQEAKIRLGDLFDDLDYPSAVGHLFSLAWEFPSVEPPEYLLNHPVLYAEQQARAQARFEEAIALTNQAFTEQFHKLVAHLADRLQFGGEDGKPKVFRDSAIDSLREFFNAFKAMNVGGSAELEQLVDQAKNLVGDADAKTLRKDFAKRATLQESMAQLAGQLDTMLVSRPLRQMDLLGE